jgi:hypothetical protein
MKTFCTRFAFLLFVVPCFGQNPENAPDTLLFHPFEGILDPADTMLNLPTGDDQHWVNYDKDKKTGLCVANGSTPKAWYWESDLGYNGPGAANNDAFTSCSFLIDTSYRTSNWLITSPVFIPDDTYWLCWRSLSYYGPDYMDGYAVLASSSTNLVDAFSDTLFRAAETVKSLSIGSLLLDDYIFSAGYIHANGYTDQDYYFVDVEPNGAFYHGKLEPHSVSLAAYAGQTIYLAFLHDSKDDYQLQVDDILVTNEKTAVSSLSNLLYFNILPNPVQDFAFINWKTPTPQAARLSVVDQSGKIVFEKQFSTRLEGQFHLEAQAFAPGIYYCRLETATGQATKLLVKTH